jgi:CheY-like chemotaxis protein
VAKTPSVLIVDDDTDTREMYGWCLEGFGFRVALASSSDAALAQVAREIPDAVITDYTLPGGDGFTFADALRRAPATSQVVLILVSGRDFEGEAQDRAAKLFDRVLVKPVLPDDLARHLLPLLAPDPTSAVGNVQNRAPARP